LKLKKKKTSYFIYSFKGEIDFSAVHGILQQLGIKIQRFELTKILEKHDRNKDGQLSKEEFEDVRKILSFKKIFFSCLYIALFKNTCRKRSG
jgi:hypothetical protein